MSRRAVAALLWFAAVWFGYEVLWSVTGVPRLIGPVVAFVVAALVTIDPAGAFWSEAADPEQPSATIEVEQTLA